MPTYLNRLRNPGTILNRGGGFTHQGPGTGLAGFPTRYSNDDAWGNPISGGGSGGSGPFGPRSSGLVSGGGGAPWGGTPWGNGSSPRGTASLVSSVQPTQGMGMGGGSAGGSPAAAPQGAPSSMSIEDMSFLRNISNSNPGSQNALLSSLMTNDQINQSMYNNVFGDPSRMIDYMRNPANARMVDLARARGYGGIIDQYLAPAGAPALGAAPVPGAAPVGGAGMGAPDAQIGGPASDLRATAGREARTSGGYPSAGGDEWAPQASMDLDINGFLDPSMNFRIQQGTNALESGAAARGGLLSGSTLRGVQDYAQNIASQEYGNATNRAMQDRGFRVGVDQNNRDFRYGSMRDDRDFNESGRRYDQEFDYRRQTGDRDFNWNRDRDNRNFGYGASINDRDFNYGMDRDNRNFGYGAQRDDREYNYRTLSDLARMGFSGTEGSARLQAELARLLNGNYLERGNAGAGGAMGQNNAINRMISQLLSQLSQGQGGGFGR